MAANNSHREVGRCERVSRAVSDDGAIAMIVVMVLALGGFLAIGAMTVDAGAFYSARRQLQTAADAAALAGVQDLPGDPAAAESVAANYATINAPESDANQFDASGATFVPNDTIIAELQDSDLGLSFARAIGINTTRVNARAKAIAGSPTTYGRGVMPFGIMARGSTAPPYGLVDGEMTVLHTDPKDNSQGNFHMVDLDKSSGYSDESNAKGVISGGGTTNDISIGATIYTQPGNAANPDYNALENYFICTHTNADLLASYDPDRGIYTLEDANGEPCRRIITCPVVVLGSAGSPSYEWEELNGKTTQLGLTVVGFAQYFVSDVPEKGTLEGQFVQVIDPDALNGGGYVPWAGVLYWLEE